MLIGEYDALKLQILYMDKFTLTVDYAKSFSDILSSKYSVDSPYLVLKDAKSDEDKGIINYDGLLADPCEDLKPEGWKDADIQELITFGLQYPQKYTDGWIVAAHTLIENPYISEDPYHPLIRESQNKQPEIGLLGWASTITCGKNIKYLLVRPIKPSL